MALERLEEIVEGLNTYASGMADLADALMNSDHNSGVNVRGLGLALENQQRRLKALVGQLAAEVHRSSLR